MFYITKNRKKPTNLLRKRFEDVPATDWTDWTLILEQFTNVQGFHKENLNCYSFCTYFVIITKNCSKLVPIMYPNHTRPMHTKVKYARKNYDFPA